MFERPQGGDRAVLVHVDLRRDEDQEDLGEFADLARSAGARVVATLTTARDRPDPATFVGSGKLEEVRAAREAEGADLVLVNHGLSPGQERNLERALECRVLDRTGLILDIFAQRARSHEGKLQVELAQLKHLSSRLVRGWTHLERQKGGIGLRGPGEKQLETDRRLLAQRIRQIDHQLAQVSNQRQLQRRARRKAELPVVSLVGYTNAGKSTLFNRLTSAHVHAADQLFATLDPTLRRLELAPGRAVVLADTVGFIRHLPHDLVAAFRSTLEETRDADLLLHVVDAGDPERDAKREQVQRVLEEIGGERVPQIEVYNKVDCIPGRGPGVDRDADGNPLRVWLAAADGAGLDDLLAVLDERFCGELVACWLRLSPDAGRLRARLHALGAVEREELGAEQWLLRVRMERRRLDTLCREEHCEELAVASEAREP